RNMKTAKWRRPNSSGNWGIVSAVRWDKLRK
ncbi:XRE family transcriptional regulator, partial [Klebsiella pneumoniae]